VVILGSHASVTVVKGEGMVESTATTTTTARESCGRG